MTETVAAQQKPLPEQTVDSESYWRAAAAGRLELTRCASCNHAFHYPRPLCPACGSWEVAPFDSTGLATIYSFTVVYRGPTEAFRADQPYVLAIVETEEGARLLSTVKDVDPDTVRIGQPLAVAFEPRGDTAVPYFVPRTEA